MDKEILETVLSEVLEEMRQFNTQLVEYNQGNKANKFEISQFAQKLDTQPVKTSPGDTSKIENLIDHKLEQFADKLDCLPKKHSFQILLFPEHGITEYYKVVFGRIFFWLVMLCIAKYAYLLGDKWITEHYQNRKYQNAWERLYENQDKKGRKTMQHLLDQ
jgi:hypothetical protein